MARLNQIIAVVQGKKSRVQKLLTTIHHGWQKDRISGIGRTYTPTNEEGERLPPEQRIVQLRVSDALDRAREQLVDFIDTVATQETSNCVAQADVQIGQQVLLAAVPVTVLLFLEKQLIDLRTLAENIPTLPSDRAWVWDENKNCYATTPETTVRTQKIPTTHVKFEPTEHQPGQADVIMVDKTVGHWSTVHTSGAMPEQDRDEIIGRVEKLQEAVKRAREEANATEVHQVEGRGRAMLSYVFDARLGECP